MAFLHEGDELLCVFRFFVFDCIDYEAFVFILVSFVEFFVFAQLCHSFGLFWVIMFVALLVVVERNIFFGFVFVLSGFSVVLAEPYLRWGLVRR